MPKLHLIGSELRRQRELNGYSAPALARTLGVSSMTIYRLEWGTRRPSPALYARLLRLLNLPQGALLATPAEVTEAA